MNPDSNDDFDDFSDKHSFLSLNSSNDGSHLAPTDDMRINGSSLPDIHMPTARSLIIDHTASHSSGNASEQGKAPESIPKKVRFTDQTLSGEQLEKIQTLLSHMHDSLDENRYEQALIHLDRAHTWTQKNGLSIEDTVIILPWHKNYPYATIAFSWCHTYIEKLKHINNPSNAQDIIPKIITYTEKAYAYFKEIPQKSAEIETIFDTFIQKTLPIIQEHIQKHHQMNIESTKDLLSFLNIYPILQSPRINFTTHTATNPQPTIQERWQKLQKKHKEMRTTRESLPPINITEAATILGMPESELTKIFEPIPSSASPAPPTHQEKPKTQAIQKLKEEKKSSSKKSGKK